MSEYETTIFDHWTVDDLVQAYRNSGYIVPDDEIEEYFTDFMFKGFKQISGDYHPLFLVVWLDQDGDCDEEGNLPYCISEMYVTFSKEGQFALETFAMPFASDIYILEDTRVHMRDYTIED